MADPEVKLLVNAKAIGGWTNVHIRKSLEQLAHEFSFEMCNQKILPTGQVVATGVSREQVQDVASELAEDDKVRVRIDGEVVITGYVDEIDIDYDATRASLRVTGTSKTGDLVDCSAQYKTSVWTDARLSDIVGDICDPFGILVYTYGSPGDTFKRFKLEPGEKAYEAIQRATQMRGMIPVTTPEGDVALMRAAKTSFGAVIELGVNVLSGGVTRSRRERHSEYIFKGQTSASDDWSGKQASQLDGSVEDSSVGRYRPLIVLAAKQRTKEDLGKRAVWERNTRAGRSLRSRYTVPEWTTSVGSLWEPDMLVRVKDEWSRVDGELLVTTVDLELGDKRTATLELMDRSAFDIL